MKFYPCEKEGSGKSFSHAEGVAEDFLGYFLRRSFSHTEGGAQKVSTFYKGGPNKFYPVLIGESRCHPVDFKKCSCQLCDNLVLGGVIRQRFGPCDGNKITVSDRSLITGRGGYKMGGG